jgi:hypothetical protein
MYRTLHLKYIIDIPRTISSDRKILQKVYFSRRIFFYLKANLQMWVEVIFVLIVLNGGQTLFFFVFQPLMLSFLTL